MAAHSRPGIKVVNPAFTAKLRGCDLYINYPHRPGAVSTRKRNEAEHTAKILLARMVVDISCSHQHFVGRHDRHYHW